MTASHAADRIGTYLRRGWPVIVAGLIVYALCLWVGSDTGLWLPAVGVGVALLSWTSAWLLPFLLAESLLIYLLQDHTQGMVIRAVDASLLVAQIGLSWWALHTLARGARWLEDPRSCMLFLVLVPGLIAAGFALTQALLWARMLNEMQTLWPLFGRLWLSRILGLLVPLPLLLVLLTPGLVRHGLVRVTPLVGVQSNPLQRWSTGELVEVSGLSLAAVVLALVLVALAGPAGVTTLPPWSLWGVGMLIVVWSALRQGVRGGAVVAGLSAVAALAVAQWSVPASDAGPLQGYLLAQCSTALLVGVSAGWIQASEMRYRHIVSELPLVLYSAVLSTPIPLASAGGTGRRQRRLDTPGTAISNVAVVTLVSRASQQVFDSPAEGMTGPYAQWLARIVPADRELLLAALGQLLLQRQPVSCEYRILPGGAAIAAESAEGATMRWVRDTLTPRYTDDGFLDGWEGFVEDITERRRSSYNARHSSIVLQAVVSGMPAGIFLVGPQGFPLFANARARQLLGQREDASVPLPQLSRLYRLHRPDGSEYPADELPVARALRHGITCCASDIVVYRADGRRIALATWAAPVDLGESERAQAAVWVLEDLADVTAGERVRQQAGG
jgi:PAS domain-containing protein